MRFACCSSRDVRGSHAVDPGEVLGLGSRIDGAAIVGHVEDRAAAAMETIEHLVASWSLHGRSGQDDVAHILVRLDGVDELLHRVRIAERATRPPARGPADTRGRHQGVAGDLGATSFRAPLARPHLQGHLLRRDAEATRPPACVEIFPSLQVDHLDGAFPRARELGAGAVGQGGRAEPGASGLEADDLGIGAAHRRIAREDALHARPDGRAIVEDPAQRVPVELQHLRVVRDPDIRRASRLDDCTSSAEASRSSASITSPSWPTRSPGRSVATYALRPVPLSGSRNVASPRSSSAARPLGLPAARYGPATLPAETRAPSCRRYSRSAGFSRRSRGFAASRCKHLAAPGEADGDVVLEEAPEVGMALYEREPVVERHALRAHVAQRLGLEADVSAGPADPAVGLAEEVRQTDPLSGPILGEHALALLSVHTASPRAGPDRR